MKQYCLDFTRQAYETLKRIQKEGIRMGWDNPNLTPAEAAEALGADAAKIFTFHGILTGALVQIASLDGLAPDISLPTNEFTLNQDGTVTIGEGPYVPS